MWMDFGRLLLGGLMLYFGAEWLVRGAAGLARELGVPPLVIGLTVVSYGTSAPELAVSVSAALDGSSAISIGNVVGSNIANLGLILGVTALIAPPSVDHTIIRKEIPWLLLATLAMPVCMLDGSISRLEGALLIVGAVTFTWFTVRGARGEPQSELEAQEEAQAVAEETLGRAGLAGCFVVGLGVLVWGGDVFVHGASGLAARLGMSERVIGLTVVAIGTSLPELAASLVAATRGHSELAVGNVVGSNLFNILLILGVTSIALPIPTALGEMRLELVFLAGLTTFCAWSMRRRRVIGRVEGALYVAAYVAFLGSLTLTG